MNRIHTRPHHWRVVTVFQLLVGFFFSLSALGQPAFLKDGLVAYYPFNGNANDESGHSANVSLTSGSFAKDRFGINNNALELTPTKTALAPNTLYSSLIEPVTEPAEVTISSWIYISSSNTDNFTGFLESWAGGAGQFRIGVGNDNGFPPITGVKRLGITLPGEQASIIDVDAFNGWNRWSHIVVSWKKNDRIHVYVNGILIHDAAAGGASHNNWNGAGYPPDKITIGGNHQYEQRRFLGAIDDVRFYKRVLSDSEVVSLYNYESPIVSPTIANQPSNQTVIAGNDATFCVTLKNSGTYNYQWQRNEQNIPGATLNCYTINSVTAGMDGSRYRVIVSNSAGTIISDTATLTVVTPPPPTIATQPAPKTVQEGANVIFNVVASGQGTLVYQWQFNEQNLPGATSATLNLNAVKLNTAGRYRVLVSSQYGVTISDTVTLTVNPNPPPTIVTQPVSRTPAEGTQVSLSVTATGIGTLTYQWQVNGQNIPGATSSTLVLSAVRPSVNGAYRVIVGNPYGTTISTEATVTVVVTDTDSDGLSDYEELLVGTNPNSADTDGDGLSDFAEVRTHKSNPLTTDTDGDGYSDGIEVARDGNPNNQSVTPTGALAVFPAVDVEFYTLNGVKYQLEVSTDMASWSAQGGVVVGTGGNQNHLVRASKSTQFWRLKVVQ